MFGIECSDLVGSVGFEGIEFFFIGFYYCCVFVFGFGKYFFGLVECLFGDFVGFVFGFNMRGFEECFGFGDYGIVGVGCFVEV